jgi:CHAT domain-containing protein/Tfp pilus assembly protein PilF
MQGPRSEDEARWKELNARLLQFLRQREYMKGLPLAQDALRLSEATFGSAHANTATALTNLAGFYVGQGNYVEARLLLTRAAAVFEKALGHEHPEVARSLNNLGGLHVLQAEYSKAEPLYRDALAIWEKALGPTHPDVASALNNLAGLLDDQGKFAEAEPLYQRSLAIREKVLGPDHPEVAQSLNNLASLHVNQGRYVEAEPLHIRSLAIREKSLGPEHPDVAISLRNLGTLYVREGRYSEAEPLHWRSLAIREKTLGPDHPEVAVSLNSLGMMRVDQDRYAEAESLFQRSLAIRRKVLRPDHPDVSKSLSNLALLYLKQAKFAEAEPLYRDALAICEKALGPTHPNVATALNNLSSVYYKHGKFDEAQPLLQRALSIREKALGPEHPDLAVSLNNLAGVYVEQGKYAEADPLYRRSLAIRKTALGSEHPDVAQSLNNLGLLYVKQTRYAEAEPLYRNSMAISEDAMGDDHSTVGNITINLAALYYAVSRFVEADSLWDRGLENLGKQFDQQFAYMSENERLGFLDTLSANFPAYLSFCLACRQTVSGLEGKMYDLLLWQKGMVASSVNRLRAKIAASGEKGVAVLLQALTAKKTQLASLANTPWLDRKQWRETVDQLQREANHLERELLKHPAALSEEMKLARVSWRDVQKALKKDEAAVEVVRFLFHDGKKWTETCNYIALVITFETTAAPRFVFLGEARNLETTALAAYEQKIGLTATHPNAAGIAKTKTVDSGSNFYDGFWKLLDPALSGAKRIFLSPDGVLNQISLGLLQASDGRLLMESYDLRIVSSTKDLLRERAKSIENTAVLIGDPDFDLDEKKYRTALQSLQKTELFASTSPVALTRHSSPSRGGPLSPLPGTAAEVKTISSLLANQQWRVDVFTQQNALEEIVKRVRSPRVLHVATHGFFEPDPKRERREIGDTQPAGLDDPMLRSGLYFAGANRTLSGKPVAADLDDGVLTAYEAALLNLQDTELVVLSACETGLGQLAAGEGVFGLRRALQAAGAEAVLMSMWAVPDKETQELMILLYQKWLAGEDKHQALREAQLEMRKRVKQRRGSDCPRLWGAFVLVGP